MADQERLVYGSEAEKVLKDCERFLEFVKKVYREKGANLVPRYSY